MSSYNASDIEKIKKAAESYGCDARVDSHGHIIIMSHGSLMHAFFSMVTALAWAEVREREREREPGR